MTTSHPKTLGVLLAILLASATLPAHADRDRDRDQRRFPVPESRAERSYQLDPRHHHDRFYPSRGLHVDRVPPGHVVVPYRNDRYYFRDGVWYRPSGSRFIIVTPPIGITLSVLPPFYTTLWVGGAPYYYADGVYYRWRPVERHYVVVEPPRESEITSLPPEPEQLFIYPREGQSEQQQSNDRYECHRWASNQSGFDPTQPGSGLPESDYGAKRADYQRATKACLEGRGYTVR